MYDAWNAALVGALFGNEQVDVPAYVDVSEEVIERCARDIGIEPDGAIASLAEAVASTLIFEPGMGSLSAHTRRFSAWRRRHVSGAGRRAKRQADEMVAPPIVGLLAVCVIAAARMGGDQALAASAYYPRLKQVLGLSEAEAKKLRADFPVTESYWRGVNEFLEGLEGQRGLPTAYSLGHRYVGIPQSQALVRAQDRGKLPAFFRTFGLVPRSEVIPADIERLFEAWIALNPCPVSVNLRNLWKGGKARERIAGVVAVELAHWDGTFASRDSGINDVGDVRLTSLVRQQFGGRSIELSFAARFPNSEDLSSLEIASADASPAIGVIPAAGSRVRPRPGSRLDPDSLVSAVLELRDPSTSVSISRRPRRVVPLRRDDLLGVHVEIDKVQLADDVMLLVQDESKLLGQVLGILETYGRLGKIYRATAHDSSEVLAGLPSGWVMIDGVQLYAVPANVARLELQVLVPQTTAQVNLAGGLRLPGKIRKWSSLSPPEIRAAVVGAEKMSITIWDLEDTRIELERWTDDVSAMVRPLASLELDDGDYEVELEVNGEVVSVSTLRLRSADTPDLVSWETCANLNYEVGRDAFGALSAVESIEHRDAVVDGLYATGRVRQPVDPRPVASGQAWATAKTGARTILAPIVLGNADPRSCVVTGAHYLHYPTFMGGKRKGVIEGVCKHCGLTKSSPASPRWKKTDSTVASAPRFDLVAVASSGGLGATWDHCLDALIHVGGGSIGAFERVASQAEASSLFTDQFLRTLEGLGHIDVRRDSRLQPVEWEANPAFLAQIPKGDFVLAGVWSPGLRKDLEVVVRAAGGSLRRESSDDALAIWKVTGIPDDMLEAAVAELEGDVYVVPDAVTAMLDVLPPLSSVGESLKETVIPDYAKASIFDVGQASWTPVPGVGVAGAYRLEQSFRSTTIWVSPRGAEERKARVGSIQLVKHLAAGIAGRPLLGYVDTAAVLAVPMGADLPGLYGRAAMLCSGKPPMISRSTRSLGYADVPRDVADRLNTLMAG